MPSVRRSLTIEAPWASLARAGDGRSVGVRAGGTAWVRDAPQPRQNLSSDGFSLPQHAQACQPRDQRHSLHRRLSLRDFLRRTKGNALGPALWAVL